MADVLYRARIHHTEKTVQQLYKTQYYSYDKLRIVLRLAFGLALAIAALTVTMPTWAKALLLLAGTWFLASRDFPASLRADQALSSRKAKLPDMEYLFYADRLHLKGEGSMDIPYKKIKRLVVDSQYLYLFLSRDSVCMMERAGIKPSDQALVTFMEQKTGLNWRIEKSVLSMNLYDIRQFLRDLRSK